MTRTKDFIMEPTEHIHSWHPACVCGATSGFAIEEENLAISDINDKLRHELAWQRDVVQKDLEDQLAAKTEEAARLRTLLAGVVAALAPAPTDPRGYDAATQSAFAVDYNEPTEE
jgi:hypothetical protein